MRCKMCEEESISKGFTTCRQKSTLAHLLLVFSLRVEAGLDAFPGLLEGLPLGALSGVMSAHSHDVAAGEDQHVRHDLAKTQRDSVGTSVQRSARRLPKVASCFLSA